MQYFLFVTKKLVSVLIYPVGLTLSLGFIALMMFLKKRNRAGIVLLSAAGITLLAFSLVGQVWPYYGRWKMKLALTLTPPNYARPV